jgi:hypothetical protein
MSSRRSSALKNSPDWKTKADASRKDFGESGFKFIGSVKKDQSVNTLPLATDQASMA